MKSQTAFAVAFLATLFIPPFLLDRTSVVSKKENRNLAPKPKLIADGGMNPRYFSEFDNWVSDRFGLRDALIALDYSISGKSFASFAMSERALEGKDGWIFFIDDNDGQNLADFYKINLLSDSSLAQIERNVCETADWCAEHGIKVLYLIAPNKHSVYSEFYPFERPEGITRADQIATAIACVGVNCLFPRKLLLEKKATAPFRLYFKTDTHWNELGAYYAYEALRGKIETMFPETRFPEISYSIDIMDTPFGGDLIPMLNKSGMEESDRVSVMPDGAKFADFYEYISNAGRDGVHTRGKYTQLPRALVFRDSFFSALEPFVSPLFSETKYVWKDFTDADKMRILDYKPDVVIFEHVERYAPNLGLVR